MINLWHWTSVQAEELCSLAEERGLLFGVCYTYANYAILQEARRMIRVGMLGELFSIVAEYPQDWIPTPDDTDVMSDWLMDPENRKAGCTAHIGTHLEYLMRYVTGAKLAQDTARFQTYPRNLPLETESQVMIDYENQIQGLMWASIAAAGTTAESHCGCLAAEGLWEWSHLNPSRLIYHPLNPAVADVSLRKEIIWGEETGRLPGFRQDIRRILRGVCKYFSGNFCGDLKLLKEGRRPEELHFPTIEDGLLSMRFIEACVESDKREISG